ncbi:MAG: hypothetical protein VKO21_01320 [Candidatus Sericytochromatia bacterium]|nr:hypothetical protein [Candidatus Sericytochromatia bacterium]
MSTHQPRWIFGVLYHHRGDPRLVVPIRDGRDHIFNYAHPLAFVLTGLAVALPLFGAVLMLGGMVYFFDRMAANFVGVIVPTSVVLGCVGSVLAGMFLPPEEDPRRPGIRREDLVEVPWDLPRPRHFRGT